MLYVILLPKKCPMVTYGPLGTSKTWHLAQGSHVTKSQTMVSHTSWHGGWVSDILGCDHALFWFKQNTSMHNTHHCSPQWSTITWPFLNKGNGSPPKRCMWKCGTSCRPNRPAFVIQRYPSSWIAKSWGKRCITEKKSSFSCVDALPKKCPMVTYGPLGTSKTWHLAWGSISWKARLWPVSHTNWHGISFWIIRAKIFVLSYIISGIQSNKTTIVLLTFSWNLSTLL